ncbi:MAG: alanine--tRNA ligase [Bacteroidetes bacterium]|nr:alanine--tRNA ligase [Bacteroidota bacterium]
MSQRTSEQIRQEFFDFFREKDHEIVPSASLVPHGDETLLFTNAGMNQFKDVFLGTGSRPYDRAADTQKCLRVSGKHNDLEEVGHDTYHHTFFEMLGNWSFGDYFKQEAIAWAWELLVDRWGLAPDRLYATVHEGDERLGLEADTEAADLWKSETEIDPDHVLFCDTKDNFWMMGETGPCGPCSEVHIDLRPDADRADVPGHTLVNADHPQVMEIWNLVFIQYNAQPDGTLQPLAAQHVDTGMGFERIVSVLQGSSGSTYDTDLFAPLLQTLADLDPRDDVRGYDDIEVASETEREHIRVAMRVIADHVRACAFTIADGVIPGNVGRGYVIRRILRRAVRYGYQTLGFREPFIYQLVDPLTSKMGATFPELERRQDYIERVIRSEEESFLRTLEPGVKFFDRFSSYSKRLQNLAQQNPLQDAPTAAEILSDSDARERYKEISAANRKKTDEHLGLIDAFKRDLTSDREVMRVLEVAYPDASNPYQPALAKAIRGVIPGEIAFLLHDTYGFPIDLTQLMAREEGLGVDMQRYDELMQRQKERARAAASFAADHGEADEWTTVGSGEDSVFVGYETVDVPDAHIRAVRTVETGEGLPRHEIVLDHTPFYAESGGQVGDTGLLRVGDEEIQVLDTQKEQGRIVHVVDHLPEHLDAPVAALVDARRRRRIVKHHTATHLLHAALREILGEHVQQKGSLVAPERLRFDFSHFERVTPEELHDIEQRVNDTIQRNIAKQEERDVPVDEALARGAMALFGEKYGDRVRVITFDPAYSIELCGGTHVDATGEIGLFRFLSEGSVAAGVRRVEAVAGQAALDYVDRELSELERARAQANAQGRPLDEEIADLMEARKALEREIETLRLQNLEGHLDTFIENAETVGSARLVTGRVPSTDMDALRDLGQMMADRLGEASVGVLGTEDPSGEKVYLVASVSDDLVERGVQAGKLVGALAKRVGGGGGGRPHFATAGGRQPEHLEDALTAAADALREMLE